MGHRPSTGRLASASWRSRRASPGRVISKPPGAFSGGWPTTTPPEQRIGPGSSRNTIGGCATTTSRSITPTGIARRVDVRPRRCSPGSRRRASRRRTFGVPSSPLASPWRRGVGEVPQAGRVLRSAAPAPPTGRSKPFSRTRRPSSVYVTGGVRVLTLNLWGCRGRGTSAGPSWPTACAGSDADSVAFWRGRRSLEGTSVCYRDAWESARPGEAGHTFAPTNPLVAENKRPRPGPTDRLRLRALRRFPTRAHTRRPRPHPRLRRICRRRVGKRPLRLRCRALGSRRLLLIG
jgi:hypothetical protein